MPAKTSSNGSKTSEHRNLCGAGSATLLTTRHTDTTTRRATSPAPHNPRLHIIAVLAGQPEDQGPDVPASSWPAGLASHGPGGAAAADDIAVPAQDRVRGNQQMQLMVAGFRYHGEQGRQERPVRPVQLRAARLPPLLQDSELMAQDQDLCGLLSLLMPASRSHAASRVVRRNMNRRHMTGDHHGQMAGRATLLARAMDEILGTHNVNGSQPPASASAVARRGHPAGGGNGIPGSMDQWRNPASNASRGVAEAAATVTSATRKKNERLVSRASRRIRAAQAAGC